MYIFLCVKEEKLFVWVFFSNSVNLAEKNMTWMIEASQMNSIKSTSFHVECGKF